MKKKRRERGDIVYKETTQKKETKRYEMSVETLVPHSCCCSAEVQ